MICQLPNRGLLALYGDDRRNFLQGLISNDIDLCVKGKMLYAALLTPQGKFLHDMFISDEGDHFLIEGEANRLSDLEQRFKAHKLRAKITFQYKSDAYDVWVRWSEAEANDPRMPALGMRMLLEKGTKPEGELTDFSAYDQHRIALCVPDGSRDMIIEKSTLLEMNLDKLNAISWTKGCYMGQELTARMHYRGLVKKRLFTVKIEGPPPPFGTLVFLVDQEVGDMRSHGRDVGLALLSVEKAIAGTVFKSGPARLILEQIAQ